MSVAEERVCVRPTEMCIFYDWMRNYTLVGVCAIERKKSATTMCRKMVLDLSLSAKVLLIWVLIPFQAHPLESLPKLSHDSARDQPRGSKG